MTSSHGYTPRYSVGSLAPGDTTRGRGVYCGAAVEHARDEVSAPSKGGRVTAAPRPTSDALIGVLLLLPFIAANAIVANRIEPFFSLIRPRAHTSAREYVMLAVLLLLILAGAIVAARPLFQREADGRRRFFAVNAVVAVLLAATFLVLTAALAADVIRCDVMRIPNCD